MCLYRRKGRRESQPSVVAMGMMTSPTLRVPSSQLVWCTGWSGASITYSLEPRLRTWMLKAHTCMGARAGGNLSPASSPWAMMTPPTMRVLRPQLVWCTGCCWPSWSR